MPALDPNKHVTLAVETQSDIITGALASLQACRAFKGCECEQEASQTARTVRSSYH
jgi:hypothetical protein